MSRTLDDVIVERGLPGILEAFRAVSGLAALIVLCVVLVGMALVGGDEVQSAGGNRYPAVAQAPQLRPGAPPPSIAVVYLVRTPAQERQAELGEHEAHAFATGAYTRRDHRVFYARNDDELHLAGQAILDYMLRMPDGTLLSIADLRTIAPVD